MIASEVSSDRSGRLADDVPLTADQARLVASHVTWARRGAYKRAKFYRIPVDDLASAAYLGLVMAARRFEPSRGFSFKTYAMPWCECLMRREVSSRRRAHGSVYDPQTPGGMREALQRVDWPHDDTGRPADLAVVPPEQHETVARAHELELLRRAVPTADRGLLEWLLAGETASAIGRRLGLSPSGARLRIRALVVRLRTEIADDVERRRAAA